VDYFAKRDKNQGMEDFEMSHTAIIICIYSLGLLTGVGFGLWLAERRFRINRTAYQDTHVSLHAPMRSKDVHLLVAAMQKMLEKATAEISHH
jgi:hypothetical protein